MQHISVPYQKNPGRLYSPNSSPEDRSGRRVLLLCFSFRLKVAAVVEEVSHWPSSALWPSFLQALVKQAVESFCLLLGLSELESWKSLLSANTRSVNRYDVLCSWQSEQLFALRTCLVWNDDETRVEWQEFRREEGGEGVTSDVTGGAGSNSCLRHSPGSEERYLWYFRQTSYLVKRTSLNLHL